MGEGQCGCRGRRRSCPGQVFCQALLSRVRLAAQFVLHVFRIPLEWAAKMQWFFDSLSEEGGAAICSEEFLHSYQPTQAFVDACREVPLTNSAFHKRADQIREMKPQTSR